VKKWLPMILFVIVFAITHTAIGTVSTRVCLADGNTPLELADPNIPFVYRDIMVGTRLTIIISSDTDSDFNSYWTGDIAIEGEDMYKGLLSARDYNEITNDYQGSHLSSAGKMAHVWNWIMPDIQGFNLGGDITAVAGDWFIIDYIATGIGTCYVAFYDLDVSWEEPIYYLVFSHVPTRDFNSYTKVDFADFALLASHWQQIDCNDTNWCEGTDLDNDGNVDSDDLIMFAEYWLESTQ
jgi:hypothetical protein